MPPEAPHAQPLQLLLPLLLLLYAVQSGALVGDGVACRQTQRNKHGQHTPVSLACSEPGVHSCVQCSRHTYASTCQKYINLELIGDDEILSDVILDALSDS
jgi:hypothetical protein